MSEMSEEGGVSGRLGQRKRRCSSSSLNLATSPSTDGRSRPCRRTSDISDTLSSVGKVALEALIARCPACRSNDYRTTSWGRVCNRCHPLSAASPRLRCALCPEARVAFDSTWDLRVHEGRAHFGSIYGGIN